MARGCKREREREGEIEGEGKETDRGGGRELGCLMAHHKRITAHGDKF